MKLNIIFILIFFFFSNINSYSGINNTISLKIGNKIITNYEVKNKILTTLILSNQAIKGQSLDSLIEKKVKEIELE